MGWQLRADMVTACHGVRHDERDSLLQRSTARHVEVVLVDGMTYDYDQWQDWYGDKQRGVTINSDSSVA